MKNVERHYRFHLRRMALGLAFSLAIGVATVFVLLRPGLEVGMLVAPAVVFIVASIGLELVLRGRNWPRPTDRRIGRDEWVQANFNRSRRIALLAIYTVQVPLMFLVAYVPANPTVSTSVVGMALLTMSSGSVALFASYLLFSRQHADG